MTMPHEWKPVYLRALREGQSSERAAETAGIHAKTPFYARQKDPTFDRAVQDLYDRKEVERQIQVQEDQDRYLEALKKHGYKGKACNASGVSRGRVSHWQRTDKEFRAQEVEIKTISKNGRPRKKDALQQSEGLLCLESITA